MSDDDRGMSARRRRETRGRSGSRPAPRVRRSTAGRAPASPATPPDRTHGVGGSPAGPAPSAGPVGGSTGSIRTAATPATPSAPSLLDRAGLDRADLVRVTVDAALRAALAMFAGFVGTVAIGLVLWAVTPGTTVGAEPAVRAATAAYVLAHFGAIGIDGSSLTLAPLLLTLLCGLLLAVGPGRSRALGGAVTDELVTVAAGVVTYTALVVVAAVTLAPPGVGVLGAAVGAFGVSLVALGLGVVRRGPQLRTLIADRVPAGVTAGLVAAGAAVLTTVAGAGIVLVVALLTSFTTAADLASTLSTGGGDAAGLALAGLAYLPNAVLATIGYATGVGFEVGAGRYGPFGSLPADLPPFPLLAAVPGSTGVSVTGLLTLLVPIVAGLAAAAVVLRRVADRRDRLTAVAVSAAGTGLVGGLLVWVGSGGVSGGAWPHLGAVGWQVGPVLGLFVLVVAGAWVVAAARVPAAAAAAAGPETGDAAVPATDGHAADVDDPDVEDPDVEDPDRDDVLPEADGTDEAAEAESGADADDAADDENRGTRSPADADADERDDEPAHIAAADPAPDTDPEPGADPEPDTDPDPAATPDPEPAATPDRDAAGNADPDPAGESDRGPAGDADSHAGPGPHAEPGRPDQRD